MGKKLTALATVTFSRVIEGRFGERESAQSSMLEGYSNGAECLYHYRIDWEKTAPTPAGSIPE